MAEIVQSIKPFKLELDSDETLRSAFNAVFLQNIRFNYNRNAGSVLDGSSLEMGGNAGSGTPCQSNEVLCGDIVPPQGDNLCTGAYQSVKTHEIYFEVWNSLANHTVWKYDTEAQQCKKVYENPCLNFQFPSQYHIPAHRSALFIVYDSTDTSKRKIKSKFYVFTDAFNTQRFIDVETSVLTNSFSVPYFQTFYPHCDPCEFIELGARPPYDCPKVLPHDDTPPLLQSKSNQQLAQNFTSNKLADKIWYFVYRYIFTDGRTTTWSPISTLDYFAFGNCPTSDITGCLILNLYAGSAQVEKIQVAFSNNGVNWFLYDTINKYENCPPETQFWDRTIALENYFVPDAPCSPNGQYFVGDVGVIGQANTFYYVFCGDKECSIIDINEVPRLFDALPILSVAQAIVDNKLVYSDNLREYDDLECNLENIDLTLRQQEPLCETELVNIKIPFVIHNVLDLVNNPIWLTPTGEKAFGGFGLIDLSGVPPGVRFENEVVSKYEQHILNPFQNFIGSLSSTGGVIKTVAKQYRIGTVGEIDLPAPTNNAERTYMQSQTYGGNYFYSVFEFEGVPKGIYKFEVCSHLATSFADADGTSTYFLGTVPKSSYSPLGVPAPLNRRRELIIDACADVDYPDYIVIADLTKPKADISLISDSIAVCGYLREQDTNNSVELALVSYTFNNTINPVFFILPNSTDQNGFYFANAVPVGGNPDLTVELQVINTSCNLVKAHVTNIVADIKQLTHQDRFVDNVPLFNECGHELVTITLEDCDGNPIVGQPVSLTRTGGFAITDQNGIATILAHEDALWFLTNGTFRKQHNVDDIILSPNGACLLNDNNCDDAVCNTCISVIHVDWTGSCFHCPVLTTDLGTRIYDRLDLPLPSFKTGGRYAISIIGLDHLKRRTFVQFLQYVNIPTVMANSIFAPYFIDWNLVGLLNLPSWVKYIQFAVTGNLAFDFKLQWVVNKVEFIDAMGVVSTVATASSKIRLYIEGLNTYNTEFFSTQTNLTTTTLYQYAINDRVRFITNGDGSVYTTAANNGLIDLAATTDPANPTYLLVDYDSRLSTLTAGATIEIYNIPECVKPELYYEQCPVIPVLFSDISETYEPIFTAGTLTYFDSYWLYRVIRQNDQDGLPSVYTNPHPFEHHSPSDFFGNHAFTIGKVNVKNPYARQTWKTNEDAWSDDLLPDGNLNGLATWREENVKQYGIQNSGGVVGIHAETGLLYHVAENNWYIVSINDNLLNITAQGVIVASGSYLSNQQQKIGSAYGVDLRDTSSILFQNNWISWADVKRGAWCMGDYGTVIDIAGLEGSPIRSYITEKFQYIANLRNGRPDKFDDIFRFLHQGYDPKTDELILTSFGRLEETTPPIIPYNNQELDYAISKNESISFNVGGRFASGTYSFTPERFIDFESGADGIQIIAFKQGIPYIHHRNNPAILTYNNFFGEQCEPVWTTVHNEGSQIMKRFLAMRIECRETLWWSDKVNTQTAGQLSAIPIEEAEFGENYSEMCFVTDANSVDMLPNQIALFDGGSLFGYWCKVRFRIDPNNKAKYFELNNVIFSSVQSF